MHDAAAPTATASLCVVLAVLPAEPPVVRHQPVKPVAADDGAHPKERKVTAQSRRGGGTSFPQLGHGEHEKMSGDVVVLQCRVGSHGACMGSARAQREARGAIFKDVLESVARKVARNVTDFRGARSGRAHVLCLCFAEAGQGRDFALCGVGRGAAEPTSASQPWTFFHLLLCRWTWSRAPGAASCASGRGWSGMGVGRRRHCS